MAIFCSKCGVKNNADDKFCKDCGTKLAGSAEAPRGEAKSEQPSAPAPALVTPVKISTKTQIHAVVQACVSLLLLGLFGYLAWYILGCAQGNNLGNGDVACQSTYDFFNSGSSPTPGGNQNGGSVCNTGCGSLYLCVGQYYDANGTQRSLHECLTRTASQSGYSSWTGTCRRCP